MPRFLATHIADPWGSQNEAQKLPANRAMPRFLAICALRLGGFWRQQIGKYWPAQKLHFSFERLIKSCSIWAVRVGGYFRRQKIGKYRPPQKLQFSFKRLIESCSIWAGRVGGYFRRQKIGKYWVALSRSGSGWSLYEAHLRQKRLL